MREALDPENIDAIANALQPTTGNKQQPKNANRVKRNGLTSAGKPESTGLKRPHEEDENTIPVNPPAAGPPTTDPKEKLWTCHKVRSHIQQLIDSGEYKVTHFQRELGIAHNSYGRFMTYDAALAFFKERERKGIKTGAGATKKRKSNDGSTIKDDGAGQISKGNAKDKKASASEFDVSDIHLDGEEKNAVPCQDTPTEVRRKIAAHVPKAGCTLADFCRTISKSYVNPQREVTARHLTTFRGQKTPDGGNMSPVYYGAFVYFEKLRLKQKKPKSKHRMDMEERFPKGYWTEEPGPSSSSLWMKQGDAFSVTKYGEYDMYQPSCGRFGIVNGVHDF